MRKIVRKKSVHIILVLAVIISLFTLYAAQADTAQPGTPGDPLISQSYVDSKIADLTAEITGIKQQLGTGSQAGSGSNGADISDLASKISGLESDVKSLESSLSDLKKSVENESPASGAGNDTEGSLGKYQVVGPIASGSRIIAGESTEIVLRSGAATAIGSALGGISDLVSGTDLKTGQNVPLNHLLLVPRNDGRGIAVTKEAYALIRGTYEVK